MLCYCDSLEDVLVSWFNVISGMFRRFFWLVCVGVVFWG